MGYYACSFFRPVLESTLKISVPIPQVRKIHVGGNRKLAAVSHHMVLPLRGLLLYIMALLYKCQHMFKPAHVQYRPVQCVSWSLCCDADNTSCMG